MLCTRDFDCASGAQCANLGHWCPVWERFRTRHEPNGGLTVTGIADVAKAAGVSKSTVSRALSGSGYVSAETRERVVQVAASLGFVASANAASLVTGQTKNVGLVIPYVNRWFFGEVLEGIEGALMDAGYDLSLYRLRDNEEQRRRVFDYFLVRKRVDAVIAVGIALDSHEIDLLHKLKKPVVGIGGEVDGISSLSIDDVRVAHLATRHLISLGHRRIVHLGGSLDRQMDFTVHAKRLLGYERAMREAGLDDEIAYRDTEFSMQGGYRSTLALLADPTHRPTAIFAGCDEIAFGAIVAARQLGVQVPAALSIVGIDGHDNAEMFGLTTLDQNPKGQGELAVRLIMDELLLPRADFPSEHFTVDAALTVRSSTTSPAPA
jgi:DNA-binding LacI/PurR family transcriptional regulator